MDIHDIEDRLIPIVQKLDKKPRTAREREVRTALNALIDEIPPRPSSVPEPSPQPQVPAPPVTYVPGSESLPSQGHIKASYGSELIYSNVALEGIHGDNGVEVPLLDLYRCNVLGRQRSPAEPAIYLAPCLEAQFVDTWVKSPDYYALRGLFEKITTYNSRFVSPHAWRVYHLRHGRFTRTRWDVGRLMLGGGTAEEGPVQWAAAHYARLPTLQERKDFYFAPFEDAIFDTCQFNTSSATDIYPNSKRITYRNCDWDYACVSIWGGASDILFENCRRFGRPLTQADVKLGADVDDVKRVDWSNADSRNIRII